MSVRRAQDPEPVEGQAMAWSLRFVGLHLGACLITLRSSGDIRGWTEVQPYIEHRLQAVSVATSLHFQSGWNVNPTLIPESINRIGQFPISEDQRRLAFQGLYFGVRRSKFNVRRFHSAHPLAHTRSYNSSPRLTSPPRACAPASSPSARSRCGSSPRSDASRNSPDGNPPPARISRAARSRS